LQKLALRKTWNLDPAIRDFVEVAENQWDFNMPGGIHGLYQDLAEGTDVSVWMAQATQSVFGEDAKKSATSVAEGSQEAAIESTSETTPQVLNAATQQSPMHCRQTKLL
jgi:predicted HNH restriction endonuclease